MGDEILAFHKLALGSSIYTNGVWLFKLPPLLEVCCPNENFSLTTQKSVHAT